MAPPRRPLVVLVLALGFVGLAGPGVAAGPDAGAATIDLTTPTQTATEAVENTTETVDVTPDRTEGGLLDTVDNDTASADSTLTDAVNETAGTADGLLDGATSDLAAEAVLDGGIDVTGLATSDRSAEPTPTPPESQTDVPPADDSTTTAAGAAGPPGQRDSPTDTGPISPITGGALVGGVVLTGLAGRALVAGSDNAAIGASRVGEVARGLGANWRDRLRPLLGLFGYQRFDDSDPLEHAGRERLYERIRAEPGVNLTAVSESADLPLSTARYHLRVLEHEGLVRGVKLRGKRRYFPPDVEGEVLVAALAEDPTASVLRSLVREGPASVSRLAERLDRDPSTVSHHLEGLAADGLVERERQGQAVVSAAVPEVEAAIEQLGADDRSVARPRPAAPSD